VIVYLDSSIVLRVLLRQREVLGRWGRWEGAYSSEILGVEVRRVIDRLRLDSTLEDQEVASAHEELRRIERGITRIALTRTVLRRAALPMATSVKTLDAIHLASALILQERRSLSVVFATHDTQQSTAARALGFECAGG